MPNGAWRGSVAAQSQVGNGPTRPSQKLKLPAVQSLSRLHTTESGAASELHCDAFVHDAVRFIPSAQQTSSAPVQSSGLVQVA